MLGRKKELIQEVATKLEQFNDVQPWKIAPVAPTFYQLELNILSEQNTVLIKLREGVKAQEAEVAATHARINLIQDHPWFDDLYKVLRARETSG